MSQSSDFRSFLAEKVNLNQTRLNRLSGHVAAIENYLVSDEVFSDFVTELIPQGSFAHGTIIRPVGNKEFDADVLVPMDEVQGWSAGDYVQKLYEAFGRSSTYREKRSRQTRCVTIDYAGDFHVDVVPFVRRHGGTYVTNRLKDQFEVAAPDAFSEWLEEKNRITNGNLIKVIRLLKYLRDHKTRYTIPSVVLTALLAECVSESLKIFQADAYKNVANTLQSLSSALVQKLSAYPETSPFVSDVGTGRNLADRWQDQNYQTFRARFTGYATKIAEACEEPDYDKAVKIWRDLFGEEFGVAPVEAARSAAFGGRELVPASERFLERDFAIREQVDSSYKFQMVGYLQPRRGFRSGPLPRRGNRVNKSRSLKFKIMSSNIPEPFEVYWKIRNYGEEAEEANSLRGDIHKDSGSRIWTETTSYIGHHYVEAMAVKDGVCVAKSRQDVIVI